MTPRLLTTLSDAQPYLLAGKIGIMPTDTVYGLVGKALNSETVKRVYAAKQREGSKPMLIIIHDIADLLLFGIKLTSYQQTQLTKYWPGPVSVILPCSAPDLAFLHRGTGSIGFRLPDSQPLRDLLAQTGPLLATSANLEGQPTATTIQEAHHYFGDSVDFYVDGSQLDTQASTIIRLTEGDSELVRPGPKPV